LSVLVIAGTGTNVGKTVVTAAIAALARAGGRRVAVVKPAQTGVAPDGSGDTDVVRKLSGVDDVHEFVRYGPPLAPATAARVAGVTTLSVPEMTTRARGLGDRDDVLIEGAGGLLVRLDREGRTIADLAGALGAAVVLVATAGLGSLNAVALSAEALRRRNLVCVGVIFGAWPATPDLAAIHNIDDVEAYADARLIGALPAGAGASAAPDRFVRVARAGLGPELGGTWCRSTFRP
jgi:dethiobiotin synthetase